ncbi:MFS transporter [Microbacterium nanhaiense]|uniref:MFS transporter n=1 Tax=Microbacterium nanhaiense TaxID=1301026 RepID=A0ABQ2N1W1_9MICO|nr:MFS transporter [Microbacterium nanhaiense]GGO63613.1 MFS transporter [Microbacterium nanhaiense]
MNRRAWLLPAPTVFVLAWGGNHFTPLLHLYESLGGYAPWQANLLLGMYVFGLVPGLLVASAFSDQHGRRPATWIGLAASAIASGLLAAGFGSFALLCIGRVFAGLGVGVAMSVGSSWIKELSSGAPSPTAGARRSSMTLTLGFGLGAGVTGVLAQWGPLPAELPYFVHLALCVVAAAALLRAPESLDPARRAAGPWWKDLRVPSAAQRPFLRVVLPAAPWVFAAAGVAYAIMPSVVEHRLGAHATLYATALTVVTLGVGAVFQTLVPWLNRVTRGRALIVGLSGMTAGVILAAVSAEIGDPALAFLVAAVLGASYGVCIVSGLVVAQSLATPSDLAGVTGVYYSLTYVGFLLPTLVAALLPVMSYLTSLIIIAAVCAACLLVVARNLRVR